MLSTAVMTYTIRHLIQLMNEGRIDLFPKFQRDLVWNDNHKSRFIETILLGLPFPEIFLTRNLENSNFSPSEFAVVDGQQRLATIHQYVSDSSDFKVKGIKKFNELSREEEFRFTEYPVVVRILNIKDEAEIFEVFQRINSVSYALNAIELTNALYEGDFIKTAREIAANEMFASMEIFSENEFSRKKDLEFVLLVMATIEEGGYFSGSKEIEFLVRANDTEYQNKHKMLDAFNEAIGLTVECHLPADSLWLRRPNLFTLIVELIRLLEKRSYVNSGLLKSALLEFEERLIENKAKDWENNKFAAYYRYLFQNTSSRAARYTRGDILNSFLNEKLFNQV
ncbi:MAG: hypothetical protein QOD32_7 [Pyrinomonadaceae bacterium]|nr:hypothetical protein [Pyrinomonadaceae bacterium]